MQLVHLWRLGIVSKELYIVRWKIFVTVVLGTECTHVLLRRYGESTHFFYHWIVNVQSILDEFNNFILYIIIVINFDINSAEYKLRF